MQKVRARRVFGNIRRVGGEEPETVIRTFKADGALDQTQVTTTEIDTAALERMKKEPIPRDRPRRVETGGQFNPGLFFVPGK